MVHFPSTCENNINNKNAGFSGRVLGVARVSGYTVRNVPLRSACPIKPPETPQTRELSSAKNSFWATVPDAEIYFVYTRTCFAVVLAAGDLRLLSFYFPEVSFRPRQHWSVSRSHELYSAVWLV